MTAPESSVERPSAMHDAPKSARRFGVTHFLLFLMLLAFAAVVWQRNAIRAWWWTKQLVAAQTEDDAWPYVVLLRSLGDPAMNRLLKLHDHADPIVRMRALETARPVKSIAAGRVISFSALLETDPVIRRKAMYYLSERDDRESKAMLRSFLRLGLSAHRESWDQTELTMVVLQDRLDRGRLAAHALALAGDPDAAFELERALRQSKDTGLSVEIIHALGDVQSREAIPALVELLTDETVYEGPTERDLHAASMLAGATTRTESGAMMPVGAMVDIEQRHVVGVCAEEVLYRLTGRPRESPPPPGATRQEVQEDWRRWLAEQNAAGSEAAEPAP